MFVFQILYRDTRFVLRSLLVLLLALPCSGAAQSLLSNPIHHHFGIDEGLQTEHIYDVVQDHMGYIWLATDVGIIRFDGHHFRHYGKADGIWTDAFFTAQLAPDSCVWFLSHNRRLVLYDPRTQRLSEPPFNDQLAQETRGIFKTLHIEQDTFFIECTEDFLWKVYPTSDSTYKIESVPLPEERLCFYQHPSGVFSHRWLSRHGMYDRNVKLNALTWMPHGDSTMTFSLTQNGPPSNSMTAIQQDTQNRFYFTIWNSLFRFNPQKQSVESWYIPYTKTLGLHIDDQEQAWVGTRSKGVWVVPTRGDSLPINKYLEGESVSDIYEDHSKGLWIATLGNGLYYFPYTEGAYFTLPGNDEKHFVFSAYNGHLFWYVTFSGTIGYIEPQGQRWKLQRVHQFNREPGYGHLYNEELRLFVPGGYYGFTHDPKPEVSELENIRGRHFQMDDGTFFFFRFRTAPEESYSHQIRMSWSEDTVLIPWTNNWPRRMACGSGRNVVFSTRNHELFFFNGKTGELNQVKPVDRLIPGVEHLFFTTLDTAWALTTSHGLFQIAGDSIIDHLPLSLEHPLLKCYDMVLDSGHIWIATNQGILRLHLRTRESFWITQEHGLVSNMVYNLSFSPTHLLAGTSEGPCLLARNSWNSVLPPSVPKIEYAQLGDSLLQMPTSVSAPHRYNDLKLAWTSFSYRSAFATRYRYRLNGTEDRWTETPENSVNLPYLSAGSYVFEVQTGNAQGEWSASAHLPLIVATPFWMNGWFYAGLTAITLALAYWIAYVQVKRARASARMQQSLYLAQNQALSAQLNPHFIHNAMNSVTAFIANRDQRSALKYLAQLSGLMRRIFENSQEILIPLEEELASLEHYLELERVRFEERFSYRIKVDPDVDVSNVQVPSLLLQPFVENALRHGILPLPDKGEVSILVHRVEEGVICRIIDNGVGRQPSGKRRTRSSLHAIEHRLKMIRTLFHTTIQVEFQDLQPGTEVILTFPHTFNKLYPPHEDLDH